MRRVLPALWAGLRDLARPRMLWLALLPALLAMMACTALLWTQWDAAIAFVHQDLLRAGPVNWAVTRAEVAGHGGLRTVIGPALMLVGWVPAVLSGTLLLTSWALAPRLLRREGVAPVARDPWRGLHGLGAVVVFLFVWLATVPVWLLPFGLALPVLLWAWLLVRVGLDDAVALRLRPAERAAALRALRWPARVLGLLLALVSLVPPLVLAVPVWAALAFGHLVTQSAAPATATPAPVRSGTGGPVSAASGEPTP